MPTEIPTYLGLMVIPDPVGVGQTAWIRAIFTKPVPTSHGLLGDMYENVTIEITAPDGTKTVMGPFDGGMMGAVWTLFTPTQVGEYKIQAKYPGEILDGMNPYNRDPATQDYHLELKGSKMLPTQSNVEMLTVQQKPIDPQYNTPPLPTEYWTRPINSLNWAWGAQIGSNWLGLDATGFCSTGKYDVVGCLQPYGTAPNTAHILWSKSTRSGGQPGGPITSDQRSQFSSTSVVINMFDGTIIMNGIAYYTLYASWTGTPVSWEAVDLRTGKLVWSRPAGIAGNEVLKNGQIFLFDNAQEYGSIAYLYTTPQAGVVRLYDAYTGVCQANITNARSQAFIVDDDPKNVQIGALLGYYVERGSLKLWNTTKLFTTDVRLQPRTKVDAKNYNWSEGVSWSVPLPTQLNGNNISLSIAATTKEVILLWDKPSIYYQGTNFGWYVSAGYDAKTGAKLWGPINQTLPLFEDISMIAARDGYYVLRNKDLNTLSCYSLTTGQKVWGPVEIMHNALSALHQFADIAYGKVYIWDMGGNVNALDLATGKVAWTWTRGSAGIDSPYGVYELFGYRTHSIADGKLFLQEGVMYSPPLHPARRVVLNCTTGELVWDILSYSARVGSMIADGCLQEWDSYDCKLYTFGKGPTQTTVTTPDTAVTLGSSFTIKGTVMDISAGAQQDGVAELFPSGLPAVSDESMTDWMEYVYKQQNKPTNATGVKVHLTAYDPNGNFQNIGTTTSDVNGNYGILWTPPVEGLYQITATFSGSESYYRSDATTYMGVEKAPSASVAPAPIGAPTQAPTAAPPTAAPPTATVAPTESASPSQAPSPQAGPMTELYMVATAAVIAAVVGVAAMALRRRK
ncbi:MAG: PQQ-binding-like beta-propeller repeat protein [Candidatus Bathyarchaeia archaeon]